MDEYYEWIKELLAEENIDLDALKTTKNPDVLTHIHEAVRDLRDSLEIVRQDIGYVEKGIYSKAKVNKCAVHGDQLVISETSDEEHFQGKKKAGGYSSTTSDPDRPINRLPKRIKERHVSEKTKCLLLGLPYYFPEKDDETESPDSSDLEEIKKRCKALREQYQVLQKKKEQKSHRKRPALTKITSGSQTTTSDLNNTLEFDRKVLDTDSDYPSNVRSRRSYDEPNIRLPPKPTKYVKSPELVVSKKDQSDILSVPTFSEAESVVFVEKPVDKSRSSSKKRSKKDRKKVPKTESAIQTSPDKEQQRYARSRFLRSDRPKSARPERRLLRLNNYLCFKPETPQETTKDETLQITKTVTENVNEITKEITENATYDVQTFENSTAQIESPKKARQKSQSCTRDTSTELKQSHRRSKKPLGKDFSSQTDLTSKSQQQKRDRKLTKGVQFSYEDLVNLNDIDRDPIRKTNSSSQTDLEKTVEPVGILKRTLTEPTLQVKKSEGQKPKFVSIVDSGIQTSFDRGENNKISTFEKSLIPVIKTTSESQTGDSLESQVRVDNDSQTSLEYKHFEQSYKKSEEMQNIAGSNMNAHINLHIKVSSNVQMDGNTSEVESDTLKEEKPAEPNLVREETLTVDNQKLTIRVISEENLCVSQSNDGELDVKRVSTENLDIQRGRNNADTDKNLDIDEISVHSLSEGDNSVFTDGHVTPTEHEGAVGGQIHTRKSASEHQEDQVDDIELIFSSDDKDFTQEDMVSFTEYEPWQEPGGTGTPILVKFNKKPSIERDVDQQKRRNRQLVKQDSGAQTERDAKFQSIGNNETFTYEVNKTGSEFSSKMPSLEKESSYEQEILSREESFDTFEQAVSSAIQRRWTKASILVETDISKCGITEEIKEEMLMGFPRRNTCPNPAPYRPIMHSNPRQKQAVKFVRSPRTYASHFQAPKTCLRTKISETETDDHHRCSSAVQTDISALPPQWRSESHLSKNEYGIGLYTLPSKYETPVKGLAGFKCPLRLSEKTQENRRVLLSDIHFTSMVPELSRSADHICPDEEITESDAESKSNDYYKGHLLQTPDYVSKGLTPSHSLTSPGISNWTVNEGSQTTQTGGYWDRGDSFDSSKSNSLYATNLEKHHRSRSVPSIKCIVCRQTQPQHNSGGMRVSESMHYGTKGIHDQPQKCRGSLPDLRHHCACRRYDGPSLHKIHAESEESTESLIEEPEEYHRVSTHSIANTLTLEDTLDACTSRRRSENDIGKLFIPPPCQLPFLPRTPETLKIGNLAKVILRSGRIAVGRIRFVGCVRDEEEEGETRRKQNKEDDVFIGVQLPSEWGDSDGTYNEKRFFDCPPMHGAFVPFSKIIMAWNV
ncbi:uncharacterized protein LOC134832536 [Culicoides brevitarsis]|uniref:uncharacterized protein LOC134832536 n=1 Tax=Culicoides brevitarsis TaxID=469753 RepID=UPI00307B4786